MFSTSSRKRAFALSFVIAVATAGVAAGATVHRFDATSSAGSEGAVAFANTSAAGGAVQGTVATAPDTKFAIPFGVLGEYSQTRFGVGVAGISTTGYGVAGEAFGDNPAIVAIAKGTGTGNAIANEAFEAVADGTGDAIDAYEEGTLGHGSTTPVAMYVQNDKKNAEGLVIDDNGGLDGIALQAAGTGVFAYATGQYALGADFFTGGKSSAGASLARYDGVAASLSGNGSAGSAVLELYSGANGGDVLDAVQQIGQPVCGPAPNSPCAVQVMQSLLVQATSQNRSGSVSEPGNDEQIQGDLYLTGSVFTGCQAFPASSGTSCKSLAGAAAVNARSGRTVDAFVSRDANETIEDEGEARMTDGAAHVALDPAFADAISTSRYLTFVTPNGDCRGLFVTAKTAGGFDVRELAGGRSSLTFDYRIVATAAGGERSRLAYRHTARARVASTSRSVPNDGAQRARIAQIIAGHRHISAGMP